MAKPKIHEISKQFGVPNKELLEVLEKYNVTGKSYMSSLENEEMDILLEYYTQKSDKGEDLQAILRAGFAEEAPKEEKKPQKAASKENTEEKSAEEEKISRKKEVRYVDTRTNAVDLEQQLKTEKAENLVNVDIKDTDTNKQKIKKNKNKQNQNGKKNRPVENIVEKTKKEESTGFTAVLTYPCV